MRSAFLTPLAAVVGVVLDASPSFSVPIIYGEGDTIAFVAVLPAESPDRGNGRNVIGGNPDAIGFKHYQVHLFWMPVWTDISKGEFVAYRRGGFGLHQPLGGDANEVARRTGVPLSRVTIPWSARNPWGLYVLLVLAAIVGICFAAYRAALRRRHLQQFGRWPCPTCGVHRLRTKPCWKCGFFEDVSLTVRPEPDVGGGTLVGEPVHSGTGNPGSLCPSCSGSGKTWVPLQNNTCLVALVCATCFGFGRLPPVP